MNIQWRWSTTTSRFFGQPAEAVIECCRFAGWPDRIIEGSPVWRRFRSISGRPTPRNRGVPWCGRPMSGCVGRKRPDDATALLPSEGGLI